MEFWDTNGSSNLGQTTRPSDSQQKKKGTNRIEDFIVPAYHRIKLKESEKRDKNVDLAKELEILWNMKVTVIPIVIVVIGTVTKALVQELDDLEIRGRVEDIQIIAMLRSARILRIILETWGDLLSLKLQ